MAIILLLLKNFDWFFDWIFFSFFFCVCVVDVWQSWQNSLFLEEKRREEKRGGFVCIISTEPAQSFRRNPI